MKKRITLVESIVSYLLITILIGTLILMLTSVNFMNSNQNRMHDEARIIELMDSLEKDIFKHGYEVKSQSKKGDSITIEVNKNSYVFEKNSFKKNGEEMSSGFLFKYNSRANFLTLHFTLDEGDGHTFKFFFEKPSTQDLLLRK